MILCCRFTTNKTVLEYINKNIANLLRNCMEVENVKLLLASIPSVRVVLIYEYLKSLYYFRINLSLSTLRDDTIADRNEQQ